jgi:hypothetical protein
VSTPLNLSPILDAVTWLILAVALLAAGLAFAAWRQRALVADSGRLAVRLVRHPDVPRPVRWLLIVAVMPIPGPFDEIAGAVAALVLMRVRPALVSQVWQEVRAARAARAAV